VALAVRDDLASTSPSGAARSVHPQTSAPARAPRLTETHDWFEFAWYLGYFVIGFILLSDDRFMVAVRRDLWPAVGVAVISTALLVAGVPVPLDSAADHGFGLTFLTVGALFAAEGWAWTVVVLNIAMRASRLQRPVRERLGDAVLPVYVIHQPVILAVAFFVVQWPLGILPKWFVVFGISLAVTLALVELALRTPVTRIILGARVRPAASTIRAPAGATVSQTPAMPPPVRGQHARPR
jgi:glucans biosynthesis protein C